MTPLISAIVKGSHQDIRRLLEEGMDPNSVCTGGNTALHEAVRHERPLMAALLLANGADWTVRNTEGKQALSLDFTSLPILHRIRQEYQRLPVAPYDTILPSSEWVQCQLEQLEHEGVVKISGFIKPEELKRMQSDFRTFVNKIKIGRIFFRKRFVSTNQDEYWRPKHRAYVTFDALRYSVDLIDICCNPAVIELANHYLRKPAQMKRAYAMRYLPSRPINSSQFDWHHDIEDRQLKLMILLSDVGDQDQYMAYVPGSHDTYHPYSQFLKNKLDIDYFRSYVNRIEIMKLTGKAGDMFIFDTNGMHRGYRSKGRVRDAFFVEFTANRNKNILWGSELKRDQIPQLIRSPNHPFQQFLAVTPRWRRFKNKTEQIKHSLEWVDSLNNPELWL